MAAAFALSCARRGEKTLLIQVNVKDKFSSIFGSSEIGTEIMEVEDNLYAVNCTPRSAMEEYALMKMKVKIVYKAVFENRIVESFLRVVPGLNELVMLGKAYYHVIEEESPGKKRWDKIVLDAPATGHGIFFFRIPDVVTNIIRAGNMAEEAQRIADVLRDPEITALNVVTLAEDMPVNESKMLMEVTRGELQMQLGWVIVNQVYERAFEDWDEDLLDELDDSSMVLRGLRDAALFRCTRERSQSEHLDRVRGWKEPYVVIPHYFTTRVDFPVVEDIARRLQAAMEQRDDQ